METAIVLLIFVITAGLVVINLRKGIQLYILLFPFLQPYIVLDLGGFHYPMQSILTVFVFACLVTKTFTNKRTSLDIKANFLSSPILIFAFLLFTTIFFNMDIFNTAVVNYVFMFLQKLSVLYIGWMAFNTVKRGEKLFERILKICFLLSIYGLFEYMLHGNPFLDIISNGNSPSIASDTILRYTLDDARGYRIQTIFYHAYSWGGYLLILSSAYLFLVFNTKTTTSFYKYGAIFLVIFLNIFFTRSRSCFLPTLIMIGATLWIIPKSKKKTTFITGIVVTAGIAMLISPQLFDSFLKYFTAEDEGSVRGSSTEMRSAQLASSFSMIKDNYIGGNGFGAVKKLLHDVGSDTDLKGAESLWFVVLIDTGIIGIVAYIYLYVTLIRNFVRLKKKTLSPDIILKLKMAVITIVAYILFVSLTGEMDTFPFFMLYTGMFSKYIFLKLQEEKENLSYAEYPDESGTVIDPLLAA